MANTVKLDMAPGYLQSAVGGDGLDVKNGKYGNRLPVITRVILKMATLCGGGLMNELND